MLYKRSEKYMERHASHARGKLRLISHQCLLADILIRLSKTAGRHGCQISPSFFGMIQIPAAEGSRQFIFSAVDSVSDNDKRSLHHNLSCRDFFVCHMFRVCSYISVFSSSVSIGYLPNILAASIIACRFSAGVSIGVWQPDVSVNPLGESHALRMHSLLALRTS